MAGSRTPYLLSKYHIPLLWLGLFSRNDIRDVEDDYNKGVFWPYLVKRRQDALALLASRVDIIEKAFPGLQRVWLDQFLSLVNGTPLEFVHLDTSAIGGSINVFGATWKKELEAFLSIFDQPQKETKGIFNRLFWARQSKPGWAQFNKRFASAYAGDRAYEPWPYCGGSGTEEEMEWEKTS